jgi:hypothetical protein
MKPTDTDAAQLLAADHRTVETLFAAFEKARDSRTRGALADEIGTELKIHAQIAEEIFDPTLKGKSGEDLRKHAYVERDDAKILINETGAPRPEIKFYDVMLSVRNGVNEHDLQDEDKQQRKMFRQACAADVDFKAPGGQMPGRDEELKKEPETERLPPAQTTVM